jgi:hypothetical protein
MFTKKTHKHFNHKSIFLQKYKKYKNIVIVIVIVIVRKFCTASLVQNLAEVNFRFLR